MTDHQPPMGAVGRLTKSALDRAVALITLTVLSPILLVTALAILVTTGRPILFQQRRPGKNTRVFNCYKFRTMTEHRGTGGALLPETERLTRLGHFLRKTSLDELPQLWNVLRGDMSLVGPRPLLVKYLPYYTDTERRRHSVLPGITGLAQVRGRNRLSWDEQLELDVEYVDRQSLALDFYILFMTVLRVTARRGVVVVEHREDFDRSRHDQNGALKDGSATS